MFIPGQIDTFLHILVIVTMINIITKRLHIPSASVLILAGIVSTLYSPQSPMMITPEMFTALLLPPIIFQETFHTDVKELIKDSDSILSYAVLGTLLTILMVATFAYLFIGLSLVESILLGVIISPTDPVSVIYIFNHLGVVKRFQLIVSGESLFNDGVSIAFYSIILSFLALGSLTVLDVARISFMEIIGGIGLGIIGGYLAHFVLCITDDKLAKVTVSLILVIGLFRVSETIGASGVIATIVASLIINYRIHHFGGAGKESMEMLDDLWEFIGFTASSIAFIFIGVNIEPSIFLSTLGPVLILFTFLLVSRLVIVNGIARLLNHNTRKNIPTNWSLGIFYSGLRGAVSIVLILGVSKLGLPQSHIMLSLTFGVVLLSNLLHGPTIPYVIQHLKIFSKEEKILQIDAEDIDVSQTRILYEVKGYKRNRPYLEKLFFSAPEYIINETKYGKSMETKINDSFHFIKATINKYWLHLKRIRGY
jgi:CPA1 family monovalent cation:H+ antiporter